MYRRLLWHENRTPARHGIKFALRALNTGETRRRRHAGKTVEKSAAVMNAASELREYGFVRVDHLIPLAAREALAKAAWDAAASPKLDSSVFGTHKDIWTSVVDSQMVGGQLPSDHTFVQFALEPQIIALLADYYGELPLLDYVTVTHSLPTGRELRFSQLWHLDYDDTRVVKLFVYLTDVADEADGPFTLLPAGPSRAVRAGIKSHRPDSAIGAPMEERVRRTGPRLSCFMVETSHCYHMGSRVAEGHERVMFTATYISRPRTYPDRPANFFSAASDQSGPEQLLLFPG